MVAANAEGHWPRALLRAPVRVVHQFLTIQVFDARLAEMRLWCGEARRLAAARRVDPKAS